MIFPRNNLLNLIQFLHHHINNGVDLFKMSFNFLLISHYLVNLNYLISSVAVLLNQSLGINFLEIFFTFELVGQ